MDSCPRVVFVSLQCPSLTKDFLTYELIELDVDDSVTFYDFLNAYVRTHKSIPERKRDALLSQHPSKITCSSKMLDEQNPKKMIVLRNLSAELRHIPTDLPFVRFHFNTLSLQGDIPQPANKNALALLMNNRQERGYPEPLVGRAGGDFSTQLFNCLIEDLKAHNLSVPLDVKDKCTTLIRAIRFLLQSLWSKDHVRRHWPERFKVIGVSMAAAGHERGRDRTVQTREKLAQHLEKLTEARDACAFLLSKLWKDYNKDLSLLTESVHKEILRMQKKTAQNQKSQAKTKMNLCPANNIEEMEFVPAVNHPESKYSILDEKMASLEEFQHVIVSCDEIDDWNPPASPAETQSQRKYRRKKWIESLQLSMPIRKLRYSVKGPYPDLAILWRVGPGLFEQTVKDVQATERALADVPIFRRRGDWKEVLLEFKWAVGGGLCSTFMLREITNGLLKSKTKLSKQDQAMHERIVAFALSEGNEDLYPDLRASLSGRGRNRYSDFFEFSKDYCDSLSGATPYRHGNVRLIDSSQSDLMSSRDPGIVSIPALYKRLVTAIKNSPEKRFRDAAIPCEGLVKLALVPQHEARQVASRLTARLPFKRQLCRAIQRKSNIDTHYNHKMNKNSNHVICEIACDIQNLFRNMPRPEPGNKLVFSKGVTKISVDDKGSISIGEPNNPIRSNTRARSAALRIMPKENESSDAGDALDHDYHRANAAISVVLIGRTPTDPENGTFRNGKVSFCVKDKATQASNPMRHAVELESAFTVNVSADDETLRLAGTLEHFPEGTSKPFALVVRSDGGSDRNVKNLSVQLGMIALFLKLDLDFLIVILTAANVSYVNEVEGVMPLANLALQHACFARDEMTEELEAIFKNANSGKAIRETILNGRTAEEQVKRRDAWRSSLDNVFANIESRLGSTSYNDASPDIIPPATDSSIQELWDMLADKFDPNLGPDMTQKAKVEKECPKLMDFIRGHVRKTRYKLEITKCGSEACCICKKVRMPSEIFKKYHNRPSIVPLPVPVDRSKALQAEPGEYVEYMKYSDTVMIPGDERFLPSYKPAATPSEEAKAIDRARTQARPIFRNNYIRDTVQCQGCSKPRLVFGYPADSGESLGPALDALKDVFENPQYDYQCGDELFGLEGDSYADGNDLLVGRFFSRRALTCAMPVEKMYYWKGNRFSTICCYCCADSNFASNEDLKGEKCIPICKACVNNGKKPVKGGAQKKTNDGTKRKRGQAYADKGSAATRKKPPPASSVAAAPSCPAPVDNRKPPPLGTGNVTGNVNNNTEPLGSRASSASSVSEVLPTAQAKSGSAGQNQDDGVARCGNCRGTAPDRTGHNCCKCGIVLHAACTVGMGEEGHGARTECYPCAGKQYTGPVLNSR